MVRSIMSNTIMVSLSLLLTLLRIVLVILIWPLFKVLEKTNDLYQDVMERTSRTRSL